MDRLFSIIQFTVITLFFLVGVLLYRMETSNILLGTPRMEAIQTTFVMEEQRPQVREEPRPAPQPQPILRPRVVEDIPVDLTEKPEPVKEEVRQEQPPEPQEPPQERQARQVYGLRRVFSQGIGAGGSSQDAIVGRLGNTLNKELDTLTATADDLRGTGTGSGQGPSAAPPVVSAASVTNPPRLKAGFRSRRPEYSREMLQNRVEGVVRARLLIGSDGMVRQVEITSDIGYDSAELAKEFLMTLQFEPAMRGDQAVSVWIPFSIRFELI
ncbi:MAG: energy transducer TonB [Chitinispirillales bacterium]|jgi:outer membrane biosynthesis protein TonB|nr:energy transducer TonB [Chitinispirillales bacterium]